MAPTIVAPCLVPVAVALAAQDLDPTAAAATAVPQVADPFRISAFASDLPGPEWMVFGDDGTLFVTVRGTGEVLALQDADGDGQAEGRTVVAWAEEGFRGIAWHGSDLWLSAGSRVLRLPMDGSGGSGAATELPVRPDGGAGFGALRFVGDALFIAVPGCDTCAAANRAGHVLRYDITTDEAETWARGFRDPGGLAADPETGELWASDAGGGPADAGAAADPVVAAELNIVARGRHYGWPYCYAARVPHPVFSDPERCERTEAPLALLAAGARPAGLTFYTGSAFPEEYRGDLLVAFRGSPGRPGAGPRVVRVRLDRRRRPVAVETFVAGWHGSGGELRGEPLESLVGPEGALYVSDARGRTIWRIEAAGPGRSGEGRPAGRR